ncbi:MAG: class I SAM-dependent methyltransferase [Candidatus Curtissbacteria bacterium]|nr:class I SAM-dependent methyltransferase [Candidatus Curtissbacteria bacterium]
MTSDTRRKNLPVDLMYSKAEDKDKLWVELNNKYWNGSTESLEKFFAESFKLTARTVRHILSNTNKTPGLIADIGAGYGQFSLNLVSLGFEVVAIEPSTKDRKIIKYYYNKLRKKKGRLKVIDGTAEKIPLKSGVVDLCVFSQVLEHVQDPEKSLKELARILKPGGFIYLSCPNYFFPVEQHYHLPYFPLMPKRVFSLWALFALKFLNIRKVNWVRERDYSVVKDFVFSLNYTNNRLIERLCRANKLEIEWSSVEANRDLSGQIKKHWNQKRSKNQLLLVLISLPKKLLRAAFSEVGILPMKLEYIIKKPQL